MVDDNEDETTGAEGPADEGPPPPDVLNGAAADVPSDVPPTIAEAERHSRRVAQNLDAKAAQERLPPKERKRQGWVNPTADQKWEEEILPYIKEKLGLGAESCRIDIYLVDPPAKGGGPQHAGYFYGSDVEGKWGQGAGAAFIDTLIDNIHIPLGRGPCRYKAIFRKVHGGGTWGDGEVSLDSPEKIESLRSAQRANRERTDRERSRSSGPGGYQPHGGGPPPPPNFGPPQGQQQQPGQQAGQPYSPREENLRAEINDMRVRMAEMLGRLEARGEVPAGTAAAAAAGTTPPAAPPPPAEPPLTARSVAELVNEVLDARERRAAAAAPAAQQGLGGPAPPAQTATARVRGLADELRELLGVQKTIKQVFREVARSVESDTPFNADNPEVLDRDEPDPDPPAGAPAEVPTDPMPFTCEPIPGSNYRGERINWVEVKPGQKMDTLGRIMAWASANPNITEDAVGRVVGVVEKIVDATTIDTKGEPVPDVGQGSGGRGSGGWNP